MTARALTASQLSLPLASSDGRDDGATATTPAPAPSLPTDDPQPIAVIRRRGTRRYVLRVLDDGSVRVTVPWWGSRREGLTFAASQQDWIARQRARRVSASAPWGPGRLVLLDGDAHPIEMAEDGSVWLARHRVAPTVDDADGLRRVVHAWLRARAREHVPAELHALAARHDISVTRVTIRDQVSRWGSCSRQGAISLNWRLVQVPPWVREYVLIHELMHRRQLNHSPRYWRLVGAACPRYLDARRWLRRDGHALFS